MTVRTRFAPSPTGYLHVGGVRTALYAWLYAKHFKGEFILRIEDTDAERSTKASLDAILEGMDWLGLTADEGPFYQTKRYERYNEVIEQWLKNGTAYRCYCSKEKIESLRETQMAAKEKPRYDGCCRDKNYPSRDEPYVVRFKNPSAGEVSFIDKVYGTITFSNKELDDLIIRRSDNHPTYNFTVVVDDHDMKISHVIRGDDHINNTPRQINMLRALGGVLPVYAHLPMILGDDGKRLSKRHGAVSVLEFKEQGILPEALLNYLVRLGWSAGDKEIFSQQEMIELFNLASINKGTSGFNHEKLLWLNQHYLKSEPADVIIPKWTEYLATRGIDISEGPALADLLPFMAERYQTLVEFTDKSLYFFSDVIELDDKAAKKNLKESTRPFLEASLLRFDSLAQWQAESLMAVIDEVALQFDVKMGKVAQPLRVAITGSTMSPSMGDTLALLGRERSLQRLRYAIDFIKKKTQENT